MRAKGGTRQFDVLREPQESAENPAAVNGGRSSRSRGAHRKPAASRQTKLWAPFPNQTPPTGGDARGGLLGGGGLL